MLVGTVLETSVRADHCCWSRKLNWTCESLRLAVYQECSQRRAVEFAVVLKAVLPIYLLVGVGMALTRRLMVSRGTRLLLFMGIQDITEAMPSLTPSRRFMSG